MLDTFHLNENAQTHYKNFAKFLENSKNRKNILEPFSTSKAASLNAWGVIYITHALSRRWMTKVPWGRCQRKTKSTAYEMLPRYLKYPSYTAVCPLIQSHCVYWPISLTKHELGFNVMVLCSIGLTSSLLVNCNSVHSMHVQLFNCQSNTNRVNCD